MTTRTPKSESFWLAVGLVSLAHFVTVAIITALMVIPWRSNFAVFQLPEKTPASDVPVIKWDATPTHHSQFTHPLDLNPPIKRPM